jgi:hypothetical protein
MSTPFIHSLITHMSVGPTPLFQNNVDSNDSTDSHNGDAAAVEESRPNIATVEEARPVPGPAALGKVETMPSQGPKVSGEVENLSLSFGLMDTEGYMDMRQPWVEGPKGEKVCHCGLWLVRLTNSL